MPLQVGTSKSPEEIPTVPLVPKGNLRSTGLLLAAAAIVALSGCNGFFVSSNSSSSSGSTSSDIVYVANATSETIGAYQVGTGSLTAVSGSPFSLGFVPQALVVSRANTFLYVSTPAANTSSTSGGSYAVYGYSIASDGSLTSLGALAAYDLVSMDVSPDGQWLVGLDGVTQVLDIFSINTSTGALTLAGQGQAAYSYTSGTLTPRMVRFAPSGDYIFAALGSAGDVVFSFDTTNGGCAQTQYLGLASTTTSDNAVAINSTSTTLYIARSGTSGGVGVYAIGTSGALTPVSGSPFAAGNTPYDVSLDPTGAYVYVANRSDGTISGYLVGTTTALTALGTSPYSSGALVTSLALEKSSTYLLAGANGSYPDLTMYSFDSTTAGKLDTVASITSSSTAGLVAIATTH